MFLAISRVKRLTGHHCQQRRRQKVTAGERQTAIESSTCRHMWVCACLCVLWRVAWKRVRRRRRRWRRRALPADDRQIEHGVSENFSNAERTQNSFETYAKQSKTYLGCADQHRPQRVELDYSIIAKGKSINERKSISKLCWLISKESKTKWNKMPSNILDEVSFKK